MICVWDLNRAPDEKQQYAKKKGKRIPIPQQLMFQHSGHRAGVSLFLEKPCKICNFSVSDSKKIKKLNNYMRPGFEPCT
jgi:hypothetical protein